MTIESDNKAVVTRFLTTAFNDRRPVAAAEHLSSAYKQHNPRAGDGVPAFIEFVDAFTSQFPHLRLDIKRLVAEGELVAVHSHLTLHPEDRGTAVMDVFRLEERRIVEHWDVLQPVPEEAANDNTMF